MNAPTTPPTSPPAPHPIPVVCDRCRAEGLSGGDPFEAFGDLLDFEPVPRRKTRPDGWDHECQRAFIAALSLTGSVRAAARAVGKSPFGAEQLREAEGGESFAAAWEEAIEIAGDERSRRFAEGLRAIASEQSGWRAPASPWANAAVRRGRPPVFPAPAPASAEGGEPADEKKLDWLGQIVSKYLVKVGQEREERLAGDIVAADFYLRQLTCIEVMLDLLGTDGFEVLNAFRRDGHSIVEIVETPFSRILDDMRRVKWALMGEPLRPEHPARRYLVEKEGGGYCLAPGNGLPTGPAMSFADRVAAERERHAADAEAQLEWEAEARRDHESRRASVADLMDVEPGEAGQPAPLGDRTDVTNSVRDGPSPAQDLTGEDQ
ncbi:MAG: hypothetical protein ACT4N8_07340 [Sphingosinicella sp.]|uniref:hypothetical protein n=1 Tax=Sphingosinicella sp. TaxID=1917971 RepID=UPI0040383AA5